MSVELYPHQMDAVGRMHNGCILCGGVGTGKSRTALYYYRERVCADGAAPPLFIVTTARKRDTRDWEKECEPFDIHPAAVDSWNNVQKYADKEGGFFIFDEQRVVGKGVWVKSFIRIARKNQWILLSATPGDTWMDYIPVFIANGYYRNRTDFIMQHVIYSRVSRYPKVEGYLGLGKLIRERKEVVVNMEYTKQTVPHDETIWVGYDRDLVKLILSTRWNPYKDEPIQDAGGLCYVLRRAVNSDEGRIDILKGLMEAHPRAIVFYNFDYELELLRHYGDVANIEYAEWNGHRHEPIPKNTSWLYFVQYNAGGEGWNCIETDTTIFYAQNYSYRMMVQASGRIDRMNTPYRDLYYYHLFSDARIDKAIKSCLEKKKDFNEKTFAKSTLKELGLEGAEIYEKGEQLLLF